MIFRRVSARAHFSGKLLHEERARNSDETLGRFISPHRWRLFRLAGASP